MEVRADLKYTEDHEWLGIEGEVVTMGITDYAQDALGDIVYVELPEVGTIVEAGETIGNIESVKAVSEIFCPVAGEIIEINKDLDEEPELVNTGPYDEGWMVKVQLDPGELGRTELLSDDEYVELTENE